MGFKTDLLLQYLEDYDLKYAETISKEQYRSYVEVHKTFDNIVLAFLVELGGLFTVTYFAGLIYIIVRWSRNSRSPPQGDRAPRLVQYLCFNELLHKLEAETFNSKFL